MDQALKLLVFPVKDLAKAKTLYRELLGVDPYADAPYYVGFRTGDLEIGLDPHGKSAGPIAYWEVGDIKKRLDELAGAGGQREQDVRNVGAGRLIATVKDADGNVVGLMQNP
ncbi:MAG TPA: VOC family protein [Candidatus Dormibacteraeota bacterium]|nr:VOC family protein [Candidatus Dormibacteraeota bacterium]